ncbi:MAG TPA: flagellar biosynthesis anti-sigma factor FlgM [Terriglobia bacterium]|nr:flagellar biosynthesis anti-sigma factor FlgM [Terriglobia bacterium]
MRVNGPLPFSENMQPDKVGRSGSSTQQSHPSRVNSDQDQAQLSVDNGTIQQLKSSLSQVPEIRQDRVDALRQAVSNGSYQVSDQQLSDAIGSDLLGRVIG